ncbi:hypothetical protein [Rosistilla oblonga]|uniref:hypothetical protein n=1 Tax=Rosistilla oblonga TaxID=2527990 RepID=UPI003A972466
MFNAFVVDDKLVHFTGDDMFRRAKSACNSIGMRARQMLLTCEWPIGLVDLFSIHGIGKVQIEFRGMMSTHGDAMDLVSVAIGKKQSEFEA